MRLLPRPVLTLTLALVWALLWADYSAGTLVFGLALGLAVTLITAPLWPDPPHLKHPARIAAFIVIVLWDIVVSNVVVAVAILFRRNADLRPAFLTLPIDLTRPEAIALLAGTITMTPGTLTADIAADRKSLLIHCLDAPDPEAALARIKRRYLSRIKEILE